MFDGHSQTDRQYVDDLNTKYSQKYEDPITVARNKAANDTSRGYDKDLLQLEEKRKAQVSLIGSIEDEIEVLSRRKAAGENVTEADIAGAEERLAYADLELMRGDTIVMNLRNRQRAASEFAAKTAADHETYARSMEGGWERFWTNYRNNATSAGQDVQNIMKLTTDGISNSVVSMLTASSRGRSGILANFRGLVKDIMAEAMKIMVNRMIMNLVMGMFGPSGSSGVTGTSLTAPSTFAPLPSVPAYRASGGPVSAGASYVVGEEGPEVITMGPIGGFVTPNKALGNLTKIGDTGSASSASGNVQFSLSVVVNQSDKAGGNPTVQGDKTMGSEMAQRLKAVVLQTIADEQRAGGLLAQH